MVYCNIKIISYINENIDFIYRGSSFLSMRDAFKNLHLDVLKKQEMKLRNHELKEKMPHVLNKLTLYYEKRINFMYKNNMFLNLSKEEIYLKFLAMLEKRDFETFMINKFLKENRKIHCMNNGEFDVLIYHLITSNLESLKKIRKTKNIQYFISKVYYFFIKPSKVKYEYILHVAINDIQEMVKPFLYTIFTKWPKEIEQELARDIGLEIDYYITLSYLMKS